MQDENQTLDTCHRNQMNEIHKNDEVIIPQLIKERETLQQNLKSNNYSFAEKILGETLKGNKNVKFNTKIGNLGSRGKSFKLKNIKVSFQESIERLYGKINILYLHNPRLPKAKILELLDYLKDLKKKDIFKKQEFL